MKCEYIMSYTYLLYHIVIRTKRSEPTITEAYERDLYAYIYSFIRGYNCALYRVNGMPDHVHILMSLRPTLALSDFMRDLKTATSKMLKGSKDKFPRFDGWESEYFACTVSQSQKESLRQYIMGQKEHHKRINGRDEIIRLCVENGVPYDERYI